MKKLLCLLFSFAFTAYCEAQIKLPVGFKCSLGTYHANQSYFTNGSVSFKTHPWGHEGISGQEVVDVIEEAYQHSIHFQKIKDGLFWATGKSENEYFYIVIADDMVQFTLESKHNDSSFSDYSIWLLSEIRREVASKNELFFTDFNGKSCFGIK